MTPDQRVLHLSETIFNRDFPLEAFMNETTLVLRLTKPCGYTASVAGEPITEAFRQAQNDASITHVIVDLTNLTYLNSHGLRTISDLWKSLGQALHPEVSREDEQYQMKTHHKNLQVIPNPEKPQVRHVFELTGLDFLIPLQPDLETALAQIQS